MCLIAIAWRQSERFPLVLAANRDEQHERPTLPAHAWQDPPGIFGGRDLREGGSWLLLATDGRLAAVTNVRGAARVDGSRSRGHLVRDFLPQRRAAVPAARALMDEAARYGPFNLLLCDGTELVHVTNTPAASWSVLPAGIHGISNGALNAAWPKVLRLTGQLRSFVATLTAAGVDPDPESLFRALADITEAPDDELPHTGVELEIERRLSPPFVCSDDYGTRASTVVLARPDGTALLIERSYDAAGQFTGERRIAT